MTDKETDKLHEYIEKTREEARKQDQTILWLCERIQELHKVIESERLTIKLTNQLVESLSGIPEESPNENIIPE
jgi:hypothetical protein